MEEEHKEKMALFEKSFQDLTWYALEEEEEDRSGAKILLISLVQVMEPKKQG